ncbi:MAG: hypothetical protein IIC10_09265, partial [Proteobacteria bacterium]|nr:hypothetical protein [Pseudomonadota bacterium]
MACVSLFMGSIQAQDSSTAWFGQPTPQELQNAAPSSGLATLAIDSLSLQTGEFDDPDSALSGARIARTMRDIIAISQQSKAAGDPLWGRIGGTRWELMTAEYLAGKFRKFGLTDVHIERMPRNPQWWPSAWEITLLGDPSYGS